MYRNTVTASVVYHATLDQSANETSAQVSISKLATRMITVLNKYIYQFTNKGSIKQIAIVVIETGQIALVLPSIAGRNLHITIKITIATINSTPQCARKLVEQDSAFELMLALFECAEGSDGTLATSIANQLNWTVIVSQV